MFAGRGLVNIILTIGFISLRETIKCQSFEGGLKIPFKEQPGEKTFHNTKQEKFGNSHILGKPHRPLPPGYNLEDGPLHPLVGDASHIPRLLPNWPPNIRAQYIRPPNKLPLYHKIARGEGSQDRRGSLRRLRRKRTFMGSRYHHLSTDETSPTWVVILTRAIMTIFVLGLVIVVSGACLYIVLSVAVFTEEEEQLKRKQARAATQAAGAEDGTFISTSL